MNINFADIDKILISKKFILIKKSNKYFIAYRYDHYKYIPLCLYSIPMLAEKRVYVKKFDESKRKFFLLKIMDCYKIQRKFG